MTSKTASGILNELAKNNNLILNYNPSQQTGPAHKKTFRVQVTVSALGDFEGFGQSIKDAKNAAANNALKFCTMTGMESMKKVLKINPTVELNILSMRAREEVEYKELEPIHVKNNLPVQSFQKLIEGRRPHPGHPSLYRQFIKIWKISVTILGHSYTGQGKTKQEARNQAASNALLAMRHELVLRGTKNDNISQGDKNEQEMQNESESNDSRQEIYKLNEVASKNRLKTQYEVISTNGPPHLMTFVVKCIVGDQETIGEGIGKKAAKLAASKKMLDLLTNSEHTKNLINSENQPTNQTYNKNTRPKKKKKAKSQHGIDINSDPVTYLTQLLQLRKEPNATYTFLGEHGSKMDRKFEIEAKIGDSTELVATGIGSTKKEAKMNAADNLLKQCGIDRAELRESENEIKKAYLSAAVGMPRTASDPVNHCTIYEEKPVIQVLDRAPGGPVKTRINVQSNDIVKLNHMQKLELIATSEGLKTLFNDYARKNESESFKSHLAVFTTPPIIFQGIGKSMEHAHDDAAAKALDYIAQHGFTKTCLKSEKEASEVFK